LPVIDQKHSGPKPEHPVITSEKSVRRAQSSSFACPQR
jgi:hypothetical protein